MYLWKYWRESRWAFGISMACIAVLFLFLWKGDVQIGGQGPIDPSNVCAGIFNGVAMMVPLQSFPVCFIAWLFGSYGVGRGLGDKSGSFLFSRPRSRAFFVWSDWGLGLAQLLVIVVALNVFLGCVLEKVILRSGAGCSDGILVGGSFVSLPALIRLNCLLAFLLAAFIFSLTYFSTVLIKHARGVLVAVGALVGYGILQAIVKHYWPSITLPHVVPEGYEHVAGSGVFSGFADHLGLMLAARAAVVTLFPLAAIWLLAKRDLE